MLNFLLPILTVVAVMGQTTAASARTMEQVAAGVGQIEAGFIRARFRCLAAGIPMPTLAEHYANFDPAIAADLKARYPNFYAFGEAKGVKQADNILSGTSQDFREGCATFIKLEKQEKKNPK